jgi:RHS repeat-associated protein
VYSYDAAGQLTGYYDHILGGKSCHIDVDEGRVCTYPNEVVLGGESYSYDLVGNRTDGGATIDPGNRLRSFQGFALTYDADGHLIQKTKGGVVDSLEWNPLGELTRVRRNGTIVAEFTYDGFGRRASKAAGADTTHYQWDDDQIVAERDRFGNFIAEYAFYPGVDNPHSVTTSAGTFVMATETPGNVIGLMPDGTAGVSSQYAYKPFGTMERNDQTVANSLRFQSRPYDSETGLYYFRARYYDPSIARFISEDPIGLAGGINSYAFAGNDPVNGRDPFGLEPCTEEQRARGAIQADFSDGNSVCKEATGLPPIVITAPATPSGPPIITLPAFPSGPVGPGVGSGGGAPPGRTPPAPPRPGPRLQNTPPSCASVEFPGNSGTIHIQVNPTSGYLQWGVVMYNPLSRGGAWSYQEYVGGRPASGDPFKVRDVLHGSVNPTKALSGEVFQLQVSYIDPFGFTHKSVPNACYIP